MYISKMLGTLCYPTMKKGPKDASEREEGRGGGVEGLVRKE